MGYQFQSVASVGPLLVPALGLTWAQLGTLIGLYMLPGAFFALPGGMLGQRFGERRTVVASLALMVAGGLVTAASHGFAVAAAGRVLSGAGAVLMNILLAKMVAAWSAEGELTTAMAVMLSRCAAGVSVIRGSRVPIRSVPLGGLLTDRLGRANLVIVAGSITAALATLLLTALPHPLLAFCLLGLAIGAPPGAMMALLPKAVAAERLATALGVYYTVFYVVMALAQPAAGAVRHLSGNPAAPIAFAALVMAATVLGLALFRGVERAAPRQMRV